MKFFAFLSPTWLLADYLKQIYDRTTTIKNLNSLYLSISIVSVVFVAIAQWLDNSLINIGLYNRLPIFGTLIWCYFLMSRNNEIFLAFLKDAVDKMTSTSKNEDSNSTNKKSKLTPKDRIILSLKSYMELLLNFSLIYSIMDIHLWKHDFNLSIADFIYYSGITITTTGYGDITPKHYLPQLLSVYEVFCGVILLVVCFAIYAGRLNGESNNNASM